MSEALWLHIPTFTLGIVIGDFLEFEWNGRKEESYFPILRESGQWVLIGEL
jgi:hypothetical protein